VTRLRNTFAPWSSLLHPAAVVDHRSATR
jgi:hypothetical protein